MLDFRNTGDWDFPSETKPDDHISGSENDRLKFYFTVIRVVFCIMIFFFVFVTSVISKFTFILITTNVLSSNEGPKNPNDIFNYYKNTKFSRVNVSWVWSLLCVLTAPLIFTFFKYFQLWFFAKNLKSEKEKKKMDYTVLLKASKFI